MAAKILLKGGIVLTHNKQDHVIPIRSDLLIENGKIVRLEESIAVDISMQVVDCKEKIISPGFVDTHHHVWQTQLKGRHADESLLDYIYSGMFAFETIVWSFLSVSMDYQIPSAK